METEEKKHWKTLEKEAKEKEEAEKLAQQNASELEVVAEVLENPEVVEEKEPSIPLSQVSDLVAQEVAKAMANLPKQEIEKPAEVVTFSALIIRSIKRF